MREINGVTTGAIIEESNCQNTQIASSNMDHEEMEKFAQQNNSRSPHPRSIGSRRAADVSRVVRVCEILR